MKLAIGTVQFGLDYGISNSKGRVLSSEIDAILRLAKQNDITLLDTASQYGDSEKVLGETNHSNDFSIITKTPSFLKETKLNNTHATHLKNTFRRSLLQLNKNNCDGLLIHQADDLLREDSEYLMDAMLNLKHMKLVNKIGVSIYSAEQIDRILERYKTIDLIQLPLNVFDQRLIHTGYLQKIKGRGIEIHVRSIFLQGLLLMDVKKLNSFFSPFTSHLKNYFDIIAQHALSPLQSAILFVKQINEIDRIIVGVTSASELADIISAYNNIIDKKIDFSFAATSDEQFINPVNWRLTQ